MSKKHKGNMMTKVIGKVDRSGTSVMTKTIEVFSKPVKKVSDKAKVLVSFKGIDDFNMHFNYLFQKGNKTKKEFNQLQILRLVAKKIVKNIVGTEDKKICLIRKGGTDLFVEIYYPKTKKTTRFHCAIPKKLRGQYVQF